MLRVGHQRSQGLLWTLSRAVARRAIFPLLIGLWRQLFALAGVLLRPRWRPLVPSGGERVLAIAPHPDDETLGCGGTIALHARAGDTVTVCIVTNGSQSGAGGLTPRQMVILRRNEARLAVASLGDVELVQMELPEGQWQNSKFVSQLETLLARLRPSIVYTVSPIDFHPEHIRVAQATARILEDSASGIKPLVRLYELQVPLTPLLVNRVADISSTAGVKKHALAQYRSQLPSFLWTTRVAKYTQRIYRCSHSVEVFFELTISQFAALCRNAQSSAAHYRGIRPRPFTDPLAWLVGSRERRRLSKIIRAAGN